MVMGILVAFVVVGAACANPASAVATVHEVTLTGIVFAPPDLTVDEGDTVRWVWEDGFHNVVSGVNGVHDGAFDSGDPTPVAGTPIPLVSRTAACCKSAASTSGA